MAWWVVRITTNRKSFRGVHVGEVLERWRCGGAAGHLRHEDDGVGVGEGLWWEELPTSTQPGWPQP